MTIAEQIVEDLEAALRGAAPQLAAAGITAADLDAFLGLMRPTWIEQLQAAPMLASTKHYEGLERDALLRQALYRVQDAEVRWAALRREGVDDDGLKKALGREWKGGGGPLSPDGSGYEVQGGAKPSFKPRLRDEWGKPLSGKALLVLVREMLDLPLPGQARSGAMPPGYESALKLMDPGPPPEGVEPFGDYLQRTWRSFADHLGEMAYPVTLEYTEGPRAGQKDEMLLRKGAAKVGATLTGPQGPARVRAVGRKAFRVMPHHVVQLALSRWRQIPSNDQLRDDFRRMGYEEAQHGAPVVETEADFLTILGGHYGRDTASPARAALAKAAYDEGRAEVEAEAPTEAAAPQDVLTGIDAGPAPRATALAATHEEQAEAAEQQARTAEEPQRSALRAEAAEHRRRAGEYRRAAEGQDDEEGASDPPLALVMLYHNPPNDMLSVFVQDSPAVEEALGVRAPLRVQTALRSALATFAPDRARLAGAVTAAHTQHGAGWWGWEGEIEVDGADALAAARAAAAALSAAGDRYEVHATDGRDLRTGGVPIAFQGDDR